MLLLILGALATGLKARLRQTKLLHGRLSSTVNCAISLENDTSECKTCSSKKQGHFVIQLHPEWAPWGVDRFLELVDLGFFHELRFFKVTDAFVQFGADYKGRWGFNHIRDVKFPNDSPDQMTRAPKHSQICFSKSTGERTSQFIYVKDEKGAAATECHSVIGEVTQGKELLEASIYSGYGATPLLQTIFKEEFYLPSKFPKMDQINLCSLVPPPMTPRISKVACKTTLGALLIHVHQEWSPIGADHFLELVSRGFFDRISLFRVNENIIQFGAVHKSSQFSGMPTIKDDPKVGIPVTRGKICYAGGGRDSRGNQLFFVKKPAIPYLGKEYWETPIAEIVDGMELIDKIYSYGDLPPNAVDQTKIFEKGEEYLKKYPKLDYITGCKIISKRRVSL